MMPSLTWRLTPTSTYPLTVVKYTQQQAASSLAVLQQHVACPAINALLLPRYYGISYLYYYHVVVIVSQLSCLDGCLPISVLACPDLAFMLAILPLARHSILFTFIRYFPNGFCFSCSFTLFILFICSSSIPYCVSLLSCVVVVMGVATDFCLSCVAGCCLMAIAGSVANQQLLNFNTTIWFIFLSSLLTCFCRFSLPIHIHPFVHAVILRIDSSAIWVFCLAFVSDFIVLFSDCNWNFTLNWH